MTQLGWWRTADDRWVTMTCVGLTVALLMVVAPLGRAPGQAESGHEDETASIVPSPYAFFDPVGDNIHPLTGEPVGQDITAVRVRNASDRVVLRFWVRNWNHDAARYRIDLKANGPGDDFGVAVYGGAPGDFLRVTNLHTLHSTCTSTNVSDRGSDDVVHTVTAWFRRECIDGARTFRMNLLFETGGFLPFEERAPDRGYTPWIRRSGP